MTNQTKKRSQIDSTVADIHRTRERISDAFGGDITAITQDAKRRQERAALLNRKGAVSRLRPSFWIVSSPVTEIPRLNNCLAAAAW